jgi:hypothetical protein
MELWSISAKAQLTELNVLIHIYLESDMLQNMVW